MVLTTLLRLGFLPLLMRCNVAPDNRATSVLFKSDAAFIGIFALFSFAGGYLGEGGGGSSFWHTFPFHAA